MTWAVKASCIIAGLVLLPVVTSAQFATDFLTPELSLELSPSFPKPGEPVSVSLNDYNGGAYGSSITWTLDGVVLPGTENQRNISVTAGDLGESAVLRAILTTPDGGQQVANATIKPLWFDIVIEPQTFTPYGYQGRAVPSIGSIVNATALITDGSPIGGNSYLYTWQLNQNVLQGGPLRGGQEVTFVMPMGESATLSVDVKNLGGEVVARRAITIPSVAPRLSFYEVSSLYGLSKRALGGGTAPIVGNSTTLRAVPYFLDTRVYNRPAINEWRIDGRVVDNGVANPYVITLQGIISSRTADVSFHVRDTTQVLQGARDTITVNN